MKRALSLLSGICLGMLLCSCASTEPSFPDNKGFDNLLQSVVRIDVWEATQKNGDSTIVRSIGSGVIMSEDGMVLTNAHVANRYATKIIITLSNLERVPAKFIGWDHWTDLAVVQLDTDDVKSRNLSFSHAQFGDSAKLHPGEVVYAVGTPHGFARTVTRGIISNLHRFFGGTIIGSGYETGIFNTWIQTDAAINPGNSGGPLVTAEGKVIGINTRVYTDSNNLGFSVPSDVARDVMAALIANGRVDRGYIGITFAPLQDMEKYFEVDANRGVLVRNVDSGSPAAQAGIVPGDIVLSINSKEVDGRFPEQLPGIMNMVARLPAGSEVKLSILRNGAITEKDVKSEPLESRVGAEFTLEKWGVGIQEITRVFAREAKIESDSNLMIIGIRSGYPFALGNAMEGDIIVSVDRKKIETREDLQKAYDEYCANPKKTLVEVLRNHAVSFLVIEPNGN